MRESRNLVYKDKERIVFFVAVDKAAIFCAVVRYKVWNFAAKFCKCRKPARSCYAHLKLNLANILFKFAFAHNGVLRTPILRHFAAFADSRFVDISDGTREYALVFEIGISDLFGWFSSAFYSLEVSRPSHFVKRLVFPICTA